MGEAVSERRMRAIMGNTRLSASSKSSARKGLGPSFGPQGVRPDARSTFVVYWMSPSPFQVQMSSAAKA
jgi:hypothetical protein